MLAMTELFLREILTVSRRSFRSQQRSRFFREPPHPLARLIQCCTNAPHCYTASPMLLVNLDPRDGRPLYLQIMDEVRRALVVGALRTEDPLPSVRELASQLVVNPRTVLQAYQELEREGVLYVRRGQGTFVAPDARVDRHGLTRDVAKRALLDARRNGLGVGDLIKAIRRVAAEEGEDEGEKDEEGRYSVTSPRLAPRARASEGGKQGHQK